MLSPVAGITAQRDTKPDTPVNDSTFLTATDRGVQLPRISTMTPELGNCNCCGNEPAVGVASSGIAAMSIAWGRQCLRQGAEPWWIIDATLEVNGGPQGCAEWFLELLTYFEGEYRTVQQVLDLL